MSFWQDVVQAYNGVFEVNPCSTPTWLAIGAVLQLLSLAFLPARVVGLVPFLYIGYRILTAFLDARSVYTGSFKTVKRGRWIGELPESEASEPGNGGVVMFVLGARVNHPLGPLAPGMEECGIGFENMWKEAEANREKWGYLGRTATLTDTSDTEGMTMTWLSYWKDIKLLQEFSTSAAHRVTAVAYDKGKFPYAGIMHETYHAPKGCWETIYCDMPPWGFGKTGMKLNSLHPKSSGVAHSSMFHRMRRNADKAGGKATII